LEFRGEIVIIDNIDDQERHASELLSEEFLGFDTESRPAFKKGVIYPVSLIQFATQKKAYLFRLINTEIGDTLIKVLESATIKKAGVALEDDLIDIKKIRNFKPQGFLSFEKEVKKIGIESNGLRKLAGIILNRRISKGAQVSNWEAEELSEKQKIYAATDAWITLEMLDRLRKTHPEIYRYK
ncbi:MAG: 3'-5' exonuclease domain-containing protein 2, partial [Cyclobacteriaceae bacterium]|nr:3'-5' exonuclease domain-containing protein 2 [Cyclobacteriaceae bacterium]